MPNNGCIRPVIDGGNMKLLSTLSGQVRRLIVAGAIMTTLVAAVAAQRVEPAQQGRMYGDPGFRGEPINLNLVNTDIRDLLSYITDQYGINFVIDRSVKDVPVTVKVNEVPWNVALDSVLQSQGLGVQVNGNILRVAEAKSLADELAIKDKLRDSTIDSSPLYTEFLRLNFARASGTLSGDGGGASSTTTGTSTMGGSADGGTSGGGSVGGGGSDQGIMGIIKRRLSRRGSVEVDGRSNTLIITDVAQNIEAIKQLVAYLDQPEPQVEIEARIVVAERNFSRDVGVQMAAFLYGAGNSGGGGGTLPGNSAPSGFPSSVPNPAINNNLFSELANTAIGLTTGKIGTFQLNAMISAGERKGQAKVIATPRVTALNNRPAEIKSGVKIPVTTIQPNSGSTATVVATTTYVDVPLRLAITPQINDLGSVILNVVAENSSTATIVSGAPPQINTQSMTTQVTVPDGGTTVVGGVLFDDERDTRNGTPGLNRVPVFKWLFSRKAVQRNTQEILFFITPRITRPDVSSATPYTGAPKPAAILQPVPMGNPPSNSTRGTETTSPVLQGPELARPDAQQTTTANPNKP